MILGDGDHDVTIEGRRLVLLPERAVYWEEAGSLLVADPHFGKAATFRASGIPVPSGTTDDAVTRLKAIVDRSDAIRVFFLGDFLHAREGRSRDVIDALARWRARCPNIELVLVRGNHDRHAGDPPGELGIECVDAPYLASPFVLRHHPREDEEAYVIAGHLHPAVRLSGRGRQHLRLPCFWFGERMGVLPAFGDFTGLADIDPKPADRIFAVSNAGVLEVSGEPAGP